MTTREWSTHRPLRARRPSMVMENLEFISVATIPELFSQLEENVPWNQALRDSETKTVNVRKEQRDQCCLWCSQKVENLQRRLSRFYGSHRQTIYRLFLSVILCCYALYFSYAMYYSIANNVTLLLLTAFAGALGLYRVLLLITGPGLLSFYHAQVEDRVTKYWIYIRWICYLGIPLGLTTFIILDSLKNPKRLVSVVGIVVFLFLGFIGSKDKSKIPWKTIASGIIVQFLFGLLTLRTDIGYKSVAWLGDQFTALLSYSLRGAKMVFGPESGDDPTYLHHEFIMVVMPTVIFFGAIVEILYYYGILQVMIGKFGSLMSFVMGIGPPEAFVAAANVFLGPNTSALTIATLLEDMTMSEIHCVLTSGFSTVAGSLFGAYTSFGVPANHLICASVMSAPGALLIAKVLYPETSTSKLRNATKIEFPEPKGKNILDAYSRGAQECVKIVGSIVVNLIAFMAILDFGNTLLSWLGDRVGLAKLTLPTVCSYIFVPIPLAFGVDISDSLEVGRLIGTKLFLSDIIAYRELGILIQNRKAGRTPAVSIRSETLATYALCGFANFSDVGISLGAIGAIVPSRRGDLAQVALRAMVAGNLACFLTACVAGLLFTG